MRIELCFCGQKLAVPDRDAVRLAGYNRDVASDNAYHLILIKFSRLTRLEDALLELARITRRTAYTRPFSLLSQQRVDFDGN